MLDNLIVAGNVSDYIKYNPQGAINGAWKTNSLDFYNFPQNYINILSPFSVTDGKWHLATATLSQQGSKLYFDGSLVVSNSNSGQQGFAGYWRMGPGWGYLDDVRIYNRALSAIEVAQLYAIESGPVLNVRKAVYLDSSNLSVGTNYQVQVSTNFNTWTNFGSVFTATNSYWHSTNYWDVDNWDKLFFRLQIP